MVPEELLRHSRRVLVHAIPEQRHRCPDAPTKSILDDGVSRALANVYGDQDSFYGRDGIYDRTKDAGEGCTSEKNPAPEF